MKRVILFFALILTACTTMQQATDVQSPPVQDAQLLVDPKIRKGVLDNGLQFIVRENGKPESRAELRLVVGVGSIVEDEDQQGLAHFVEHMAFNGTQRFPKQELIDYLESMGMQFGADTNAYTTFDETVYMLQVPTDSTALVETAFQILEDWAHQVSFEGEEIDKERGVVIEEWRGDRGADARMRDKQYPILLKDSQYAKRPTIGEKAVLDTFRHETLRRFYKDWYRPDLMSVIAVGDFDGAQIEELIRDTFSRIPRAVNPRPRKVYPVPDHDETLFAIASDSEAARSRVIVYYKLPVGPYQTEADYRQMLVAGLYNRMLNQRLFELTKQEDPPYLGAGGGRSRFVGSKDAFSLGAVVKNNGIEPGLEALLTEAARVQRHGFTQAEMEREKKEMLRSIERSFKERDKGQSRGYASEYVRHFTVDEPIPGIDKEYAYYQTFVPEIQLDEVNRLGTTWISDRNRVMMVNVPEKEGVKVPAEADLLAVMATVQEKEIEPYQEDVSDLPLVEQPPTPGQILSEKTLPELGVTEWVLSNGVRVVLKPTDFKNDEVHFTAFSPGGHSLVSDEDYIAATTAAAVISESGLGTFNQIQLGKKLAGKAVGVSSGIDGLGERVSGNASPEDLETMFQLIYLTFTAPRVDSTAFKAFQSRVRGFLENRGARPETAFSDTLSVTLLQYHHRARPWSESMLDEMDLQRSFEIYQDRFADASDFTFFFVGNFDPATLKPLVQVYLGGLPSLGRRETWKDVGMRYPKGVIKKTVWRGQEPKSLIRMVFTGPFEWSWENRYALESMRHTFEIKLMEVLREDLAGTYGVGVRSSRSHYPAPDYSLSVTFGCNPDRVEELTQVVFSQIDSLKQVGLPQSYIDKVKEIHRRDDETDLKENGHWLGTLRFYYYHQEDPHNLLKLGDRIDSLTPEVVRGAAQKYFDLENYVQVVLKPEKTETP